MTQVDALHTVRPIAFGPKFHWFGYYDKLEIDPSGRYVLAMEVDFEHRSPTADDVIKVGMVDLGDGDRWIELGESRAWCWQQGCMLQWLPGRTDEVIWNDRQGERFVCHILNIETGAKRTWPHPVYTLNPNGRTAIGTDFRRINHLRPGYGYAGLPDPNVDVLAPDDAGIYRLDLETGQQQMLFSIADIAHIPYPHADLNAAKHWFNHLLFNTDGTRFEFLHRWRLPGQPGFGTRMLTANLDGSDIHIVDDYGQTSHFIWRDPAHILAWAWHPSHEWAFYLYEDSADGSNRCEVVGQGVIARNGHCTYLPKNEWILNDAYPDANRSQELYLYHIETGRKVLLGNFHSPEAYTGEWRCDLHPRASPDGTRVVIDSPHGGDGRQIYLIDIGGIIGM
ncbi:MAG: hypothetical protein JW934_10760 [Anaerolineae bacterium]|nr:hypothetical protein [Anaerolineae bacterium]